MKPIFILILIVAGCSTADHASRLSWTPEYLIGKTIEQDSDTAMNIFSFGEDSVAATIGKKGGLTAAPLLYWKIDPQGRLIITNGDSITYPPFSLIRKSEKALWVRTPDGQKLKFKILDDEGA